MPVRITCASCDKKLQIRDDAVGKKIKCPGCGAVFVGKGDASAGIKAAPSRPSTTATTRTPPPPKTAPKPQAKRPAPPPPDEDEREDDEELDERPMRQSKRPAPPPLDDDEDERDDEELDERPARQAKSRRAQPAKSSSRMVLWLALGLVIVIGGGVAAYFVFFHDSGAGSIAKNNPANVNHAQQGGNPAAQPGTALADLVPGDSLAFASVSGELWNAPALAPLRQGFGKELEAGFEKNVGFPLADLERVSMFTVATFAEAKQNKTAPVVVLVQAKQPLDQKNVMLAIRGGEFGKNPNFVVDFVDERSFVASLEPLVQAFKEKRGKIKASGVIERAIQHATASKGAVAAVTIPPEAAQEAQQGAPPQFAVLTKAREFFASVDLGDKLLLNASLVMEDAASASEAKKTADGFIAMAGFMLQGGKDPQMAMIAKAGQQALNDLKLDVKDKEITLAFQADPNLALGLVLPAIEKVRAAAVKVSGGNNLKQIGLAWHNYMAVHKTLPPQTFNKGLSWRVAILPYLEQSSLYQQFKLDEPWDSPHNRKLIPLMPQIYAAPGADPTTGRTHYQTFVGPKTINPNPQKGLSFRDFIDGTTNTIVVAEATQPVEWTKPDDIVVTPSQPIMLGAGNSPTAAVLFADAAVRQLPRTFDQKMLQSLIDPRDGMIVQLP